jgi:hypothetical protein
VATLVLGDQNWPAVGQPGEVGTMLVARAGFGDRGRNREDLGILIQS